ncbi:MAG: FHA domain-containing protein [Archangium sp.]
MKTFTVSPTLQALLEQMSADMAVPVDGLVNQGLFNWAKLHGYLSPGEPEPAFDSDDEPPTTRRSREAAASVRRMFLVMEHGEVELEGERFLIGRDVSCNYTIDSPRLSRQHVALSVRPEGLEVVDLGSSNGTWFNGERITQRTLLDGDELYFGDVLARVEFR